MVKNYKFRFLDSVLNSTENKLGNTLTSHITILNNDDKSSMMINHL